MSLALIQETAKEVRRLAVAGSPLAVGDFRLKKLIPPLEQAGAKVPVFAQVAKALSDLANGNENDSAANLLSLSTLVNAILYTQGQTTADGECRDLEMFAAVSTSTRTSARVLKPLVEALTNAGAGRFEVVKAGCERGAFNDLRLIDPAIRALDDNYGEIADLVAEKILPNYGPGIIPRLKEKFDLKGKKADGRRLQAMHRLDPAGTIALCKTTLEEGSAEVKVAAIACLRKHEECVPVLLPEANSKNKSVRAATLEALARHDRPEITNLFIELVKGRNLDILAAPFRGIRNSEVMNALLSEGQRVFELMVKGEADQIQRYSEILDCLKERQTEAEEFLLACFNQCDKLAKLKAPKNSTLAGADLIARLAELLSGGSPKALETILVRQELIPPTSFDCVVNSALRAWPPDKVYQEFAPLLDQKKGAGQQKSEAVQTAIFLTRPAVWPGFPDLDGGERGDGDLKSWDPRWLDAAIKADLHSLVCLLARPNHKGVIAYLLKPVDLKEPDEAGQTVAALSVCQYPKVTDVFLDLVAKSTKSTRNAIYQVHFLFQSAKYLPTSELPRLEAFAAKLDEKFVDQFLEALEPLRAAKQTT